MIVVYGYNAASHSLGVVCILGAEGCVVDVDLRGPMRSVTKAKYPELLADFPSEFKVAS